MKYQFCICFQNTTVNSAATKAVADCSRIFLEAGYADYTFTVWDNSNKLKYYLKLARELLIFFKSLKPDSVVGIQYPLLSIVNKFHFFIVLAKIKRVKFFCIIHDLESLRSGGTHLGLIAREIANLNRFDCVIVHNEKMQEWLQVNGLRSKTVILGIFDYLNNESQAVSHYNEEKSVAFAGNLGKSIFIHKVGEVPSWQFNVYGPHFDKSSVPSNLNWKGNFSPEEVVNELAAGFGLIWDGKETRRYDEVLGNYLKYNNPHKFSLYMAAGLPVIAPVNSAIADFIRRNDVGILVNNLQELELVKIDSQHYSTMKANIQNVKNKVCNGWYFRQAIDKAEKLLN